ncbi:AbrB/MazE/SpoVT family DNA-binding domain-containing protein [Candidatus Woesebacteria bacterium]|nr:AbrB/MazE/SpoVT family DNA-binding domain-containing protein [Candidatus Woesebacteria bacterium]
MQRITVGTKNQIVIPLEIRKKISGLRPGASVEVYALDSDTIAIKVPEESWIERSYGFLSTVWPEDAAKQVKKQRESWDAK